MSSNELRSRPARIPEMHDLGRQCDGLDCRRRHSPVSDHWPRPGGEAEAAETGFTFAQVSDSHLGFDKPVNPNVAGTFQEALGHVTSMSDKACLPDPHRRHHASFHRRNSSTPAHNCWPPPSCTTYTVPGEHDILEDERQELPEPLRQGHQGRRLVQLQRRWRAFHRSGQRRQSARQRARRSGSRSA